MKPETKVRICVPLCVSDLSTMQQRARVVAASGDLVELRLDCLDADQLASFPTRGNQLLSELCPNVILTFRDPTQGGQNEWSMQERLSFWNTQLRQTHTWCDLEPDVLTGLPPELATSIDWSHVICSHHDFAGVPENLDSIYELLAATPARVIKIAIAAHDVVDCLSIFRLLERAQRNRELIAIAMGPSGLVTRILGPSRGAYLTFGAYDLAGATAPGQITAQELRSVYRIDQIDRATHIAGLVGLPAMHSVSPHMHNAAFAAQQINGVYLPFEVSDIAAFFKRMVHPATRDMDWNLVGLSITAPHKSTVMNLLDWIAPEAREIGAVNTVVIEDKRLLGYNTDANGFLQPLLEKIESLTGCQVAILGAGGAANAVAWALINSGARVTVHARNAVKGQSIANRFGVQYRDWSDASFAGYDVVVNTTPLGSHGTKVSETPAVAAQLRGAKLVYDLVYNPIETRLLREAKMAGCERLDGLSMLVNQALSQFHLWTGETVDHSIMHDAALTQLRSMTQSSAESQS